MKKLLSRVLAFLRRFDALEDYAESLIDKAIAALTKAEEAANRLSNHKRDQEAALTELSASVAENAARARKEAEDHAAHAQSVRVKALQLAQTRNAIKSNQ